MAMKRKPKCPRAAGHFVDHCDHHGFYCVACNPRSSDALMACPLCDLENLGWLVADAMYDVFTALVEDLQY